MTREELAAHIINGDRESLCREMAPLNEAQRGALADDALALLWLVLEFCGPQSPDVAALSSREPEATQFVTQINSKEYADWRIPRLTASLGVLGLCRREQLSLRHIMCFADDLRDMPQRVAQVLNDRRPAWLAEWIKAESRLANSNSGAGCVTWPVERRLIRSGALPPNSSDEAIVRMVNDLPVFVGNSRDFEVTTDSLPPQPESLTAVLLDDPDLLQRDVWRLFEIENPAFENSWSSWPGALCELMNQSQLDRRRLLQASVQALALPFRAKVRSGYVSFHEALKPSIDERAEFVASYYALLSNDSPLVVGAAISAFEELAKAKRLDAVAFVEACPPLFRLETKGPPAKALKIIKKLLKAEPACRCSAASVLPAGLRHASPDVQEAALELLESLHEELTTESLQEIAACAEQVAASLRARLEALTAKVGTLPSEPAALSSSASATASVTATASATSSELSVLETSDLPIEWLNAAGVSAARQAIADETDPFPVPIDPRCVPRRDPSQLVQPIASLDELIDAVSAFVERVDDAMEVERILDGIFRFRAEKPSDFDKRVAPLKKRIEAKSEPYSGSVLDVAADAGISQVIRCWLQLPEIHRAWGDWYDSATQWLRIRTRELLYCFDSDRRSPDRVPSSLPSLSLPTHRDGWLDPVELVRRIKVYVASKNSDWGYYSINDLDLAQALLRLTPDGRREALELAADLEPHAYIRTLRFALGESVELKGIGRNDVALFFAAAHCRAVTHPTDPGMFPTSVPEVALREDGSLHISGAVTDDLAFPGDLLLRAHSWNASVSQQDCWGSTPSQRDWLIQWQSLCWPINRRPMCLLGSSWQRSSPEFLQNLLERDTSWGEEAARLAVLAMGTDVPRSKGLVTDALIDAFAEQLADPRLLGRHLAANVDRLMLNRVAPVLSEVARVSPLNHWSVFMLLDHFLGRLATAPKDLHQLLTPYLESATICGRAPSDEALRLLRSITGSSKAAKLAKELCGLSAVASRMRAVRDAALSARYRRAQRFGDLWLQ